jgi:hypothetical protein
MKQLLSRPKLLLGAGGLVFILFLTVVPRMGGDARRNGFGGWALIGLGVLSGVVIWNRSRGRQAREQDARLKLLERMQVAAGQALVLIEVDGNRMLLATSSAGLRLVAQLGSEAEPDIGGGSES